MQIAFLHIIFFLIVFVPLRATDIIVTNSRKIIVGNISEENSTLVTISDHRKTYKIPHNITEFRFHLPDLTTKEKLALLPKGLPISLPKIGTCRGLFYGVSGDKILVISRGETKSFSINAIEKAYKNDFPDIRLFNLLRLLENEREHIELSNYELGEFEAKVIHFDSDSVKVVSNNDTLSLPVHGIISVAGETLFDYKEHRNKFSKRYLFLPSAYIGRAEESSAETVDLYYNAFAYNISSWLQISGGFASINLIEQFEDNPISFSIKGALPVSKNISLFSEILVFYANSEMPGLSHLGLNYGSTENNISVIYSYQSKLEDDFAPNILSAAGVCRLYKSLYFTTEFSVLGEGDKKAYITSNALQLNLSDISFKLGAIYFIAEKKEYSILPLLKAEFDF